MSIHEWLETFKASWVQKDPAAVLALFSEDVEYWETPFRKLRSYDELKHEWQGIENQNDISLHIQLFGSAGNRHAAVWHLRYCQEGKWREVAGTYLITLDDNGRCTYFHHTGELQPA